MALPTSRQGRLDALRDRALLVRYYAAVPAARLNNSPVLSIACIITASLRATSTPGPHPSAIKSMIGKGFILSGTSVDLVKVGVGVAVKEGEPKPDISSVDAFKRALLAAHSVTYIDPASGGSCGIYLANLFKRLGIAAEIKPKSILSNGGLSAMFLVSGQADIAIQQISELMLVKGVTVVGPLPAAIQNYTVYTGGISAHSEKKDAASAFLKLLSSPAAAQLLQEKGMEPADP
jgi:molybdate transport system substrate-binding protein